MKKVTQTEKKIRRVIGQRLREVNLVFDRHLARTSARSSCTLCTQLQGQILSLNFVRSYLLTGHDAQASGEAYPIRDYLWYLGAQDCD